MKTLFLAGTLLISFSCFAPPLQVESNSGVIVVDFRTLGEYGSHISRIQLKEREKQVVVWEVEASTGLPHLWKVELQLGENSADINKFVTKGSYEVIVPNQGGVFALRPNVVYSLEVWDDGPRSSSSFFSLE